MPRRKPNKPTSNGPNAAAGSQPPNGSSSSRDAVLGGRVHNLSNFIDLDLTSREGEDPTVMVSLGDANDRDREVDDSLEGTPLLRPTGSAKSFQSTGKT